MRILLVKKRNEHRRESGKKYHKQDASVQSEANKYFFRKKKLERKSLANENQR